MRLELKVLSSARSVACDGLRLGRDFVLFGREELLVEANKLLRQPVDHIATQGWSFSNSALMFSAFKTWTVVGCNARTVAVLGCFVKTANSPMISPLP